MPHLVHCDGSLKGPKNLYHYMTISDPSELVSGKSKPSRDRNKKKCGFTNIPSNNLFYFFIILCDVLLQQTLVNKTNTTYTVQEMQLSRLWIVASPLFPSRNHLRSSLNTYLLVQRKPWVLCLKTGRWLIQRMEKSTL